MSAATQTLDTVQSVTQSGYKWGFETDIEMDLAPKGLNEDIIRLISSRKEEPAWLLEWRLKAFAAWQQMTEPHWARVEHARDRLPGPALLCGAEEEAGAEEPGRGRSGVAEDVREAGHSAEGAGHPRGRRSGVGRRRQPGRGGRGVRQRLGRDHVPRDAAEGGRDLLPDLRGGARSSGAGAAVSRHGGADLGQLLRRAEFGGVHRRQLRLRAEGRALPDGALHLFPHQCAQHRPVRAHADHRRCRRLRELPGRLHRADARREPVARGGGRAGRARRCADQVFDGAELVPGRRGRPRRHLQLRHQARRLPRRAVQDFLDAGGDRFGDHLEVSVLRAAGRRQRRRVLLGGGDQQPPAGRYRHQDDPYRQADARARSSRRASAPGGRTTPIAGWCACCRGPPGRATTPSATAC